MDTNHVLRLEFKTYNNRMQARKAKIWEDENGGFIYWTIETPDGERTFDSRQMKNRKAKYAPRGHYGTMAAAKAGAISGTCRFDR